MTGTLMAIASACADEAFFMQRADGRILISFYKGVHSHTDATDVPEEPRPEHYSDIARKVCPPGGEGWQRLLQQSAADSSIAHSCNLVMLLPVQAMAQAREILPALADVPGTPDVIVGRYPYPQACAASMPLPPEHRQLPRKYAACNSLYVSQAACMRISNQASHALLQCSSIAQGGT